MQLLNLGLKGKYCIHKVINPGSILEYKIPLLSWFDNLITNAGLDMFCSNTGLSTCGYGHVGSSNTTPNVGDTQLGASLVSNGVSQYSNTVGNYGSPNYTKYWRSVHRYLPGIGTGNIAEVGIGTSTKTTPYLFSRALILDAYGTPTTITKLSDETLDVTYELQLQFPISDFTGSFTLSGDKGASYTYTGRSSRISSSPGLSGGAPYSLGIGPVLYVYNGSLGTITAYPSGSVTNKTATVNSYTPGSYTRTYLISSTINEFNLSGGISCIEIYTQNGGFQFQLNSAIPKTSTDSFTLNFSLGISRT